MGRIDIKSIKKAAIAERVTVRRNGGVKRAHREECCLSVVIAEPGSAAIRMVGPSQVPHYRTDLRT